MKRLIISIAVSMLLIGAVPFTASAASAIVSNYFYAHANTTGTIPFKDKYNSSTIYGDGIEHDASITAVRISAQGLSSGDKIQVVTDRGTTIDITPDVKTTVVANDWIKINLIKIGTNEVFAKLDEMWAHDASNGGTDVNYTFSVNEIPTSYGQLGNGGGTASKVPGTYTYFEPKDAYQYTYTAPNGVTRYVLSFTSPSGQTASKSYTQTPSGIHYLTCNGDYVMSYYDASDQLVGISDTMHTTAIKNASCSSYADGASGFNDLNIRKTTGTDGNLQLEWDKVPGATWYEVYKDGLRQGGSPYTTWSPIEEGHTYSVIAKTGENGTTVGQSDVNVQPGGETPSTGTDCDGCKLLTDMLACPGWSQYMGDLTQAVKNALPPPPDWDSIADKIGTATVNHLSTYLGDVPDVPSSQLIKDNTSVPLPNVDNSVPEADQLTPSMPPDFNSPIPYNIDDGPQIEVKDESKPFDITDPLSGMQIDDPGTPVIPGDPRNSSDGIKEPDRPNTGGVAIPSKVPDSSLPIPSGGSGSIPNSDTPQPSHSTSTIPMPSIPPSDIPIPKVVSDG